MSSQSLAIVALTGKVFNVFDLTQPENLEGFVAIIAKFTIDNAIKKMATTLEIRSLSLPS